jgi:hypothetical protein
MQNPQIVRPANKLYCSVSELPWREFLVPAFCLGMMAFVVALESASFPLFSLRPSTDTRHAVAILANFLVRWTRIARAFPLKKRRPSLALAARLSLFTIYSAAVMATCVVFIKGPVTAAPYLIQASCESDPYIETIWGS